MIPAPDDYLDNFPRLESFNHPVLFQHTFLRHQFGSSNLAGPRDSERCGDRSLQGRMARLALGLLGRPGPGSGGRAGSQAKRKGLPAEDGVHRSAACLGGKQVW